MYSKINGLYNFFVYQSLRGIHPSLELYLQLKLFAMFNIRTLLLALSFISIPFLSAASDTLHVITHNKETVVTEPAQGNNYYKRWGVFPNKNIPIRKIILHVRFGCPDSMRCADWDYLDFIKIKRTGGVNGGDKDFEIARMLTPYGGAFAKDWKFDWEVDVTDFSLLLRDSVEIEYNHTGWEPNKDRGWKITLDFEIIKGIPAAEPVSIQKIYSGAFLYGDSAQSIEEKLPLVSFTKNTVADFAKLRVLHTGHGANPGDYCGEFCSKNRMIYFNGDLMDKRPIWKKCGDNPLYPQAGTWLYDRANWCPGYLQIPDEYLFPLQQNNNSINIDMEPYKVTKSEAVENITAYIIQYKKAVAQNDVAILDIIAPTTKQAHLRKNPVCVNPVVVIKNNGSRNLTSLKMNYGTKGFKEKTYAWKGNLAFGQSAEIILPGAIDAKNGNNYFSVSLQNPNKNKDAFPGDNSMGASFEKAPVHARSIVVVFKTNNEPADNNWKVTDAIGKTLYSRGFDSTQKNKLFRDTLNVKPGCYQFAVEDTSGNGLEFWANVRGGRGYVRLQDTSGNLVKNFISDFGNNVVYNFSVSDNPNDFSPLNTEASIELYPTRTTGKTELEYFSGTAQDVKVQIITDEGQKLVEEHLYKNLKEGSFTYDMSYLPAQRYYVKVFVNGELKFNKRLRVESARN